MKSMITRVGPWGFILLVLVFTASSELSAQSEKMVLDQTILDAIDRGRNFETLDISCLLTVLTTHSDGEKDTIEGRYFRRDREDKFTLIISAPRAQMGQGYLQVDSNLWFYDPETRAFAHRTVKDNFQDSKARNDDFTSTSYGLDYRVTSSTQAKLKNIEVLILEIQAKNDRVPYAKQKLWVRSDKSLILKQECYGDSGKLMVTYAFPAYTLVKGTYVPEKIFIRDELRPKESTEITLEKISVGTIDDKYFTKAFLEQNSR